jgi:hypothetical protein
MSPKVHRLRSSTFAVSGKWTIRWSCRPPTGAAARGDDGRGLRAGPVAVQVVDDRGDLDGRAGRELLGVDGDPVRRVVVGAGVGPLAAADPRAGS